MAGTFVEIIGTVAGLCTIISFIPQIIKTYKARSVGDISLMMYSVITISSLIWIAYGMLMGAPLVVVINIICFCLTLLMLLMKRMWGKKSLAT